MATQTLPPVDSTLQLHNSVIRAPYSTPAAPSMADSLPNINWGFEDLRARMSSFTQRFDEFIEKGRRRVLEERNGFLSGLESVRDEQAQNRRKLSALTSQTDSHAKTLSAQSVETDEMHAQIASFTTERDTRAQHVNALKTKLATTRQQVNAKKTTQRQHAQYLAHQASFNERELQWWEDTLKMRVESTGTEDRVRFIYWDLSKKHGENEEGKSGARDCWFELDMSGSRRRYEIVAVKPRIDKEKVESYVVKLCEGGELGTFLKGMRESFIETID